MFKDKILAFLDAKYSKTGLTKEAKDALVAFLSVLITKEEDIETVCSKPEVETALKGLQSEADRLRNEKKMLEEKLAGISKTTETTETKDKDTKDKDTKENNAILEAVKSLIQPLAEKVNNLTSEKAHETHTQKLLNTLNEKKIPKSFYEPIIDGRTFQKEEDTTAILDKIENAYKGFKQVEADESLAGAAVKPIIGIKQSSAAVKADIESWGKRNEPQQAK